MTANFAINTYALSYRPVRAARSPAPRPQTVDYGQDGRGTAVPNTGYHFVDWSDGLTTASRTDTT